MSPSARVLRLAAPAAGVALLLALLATAVLAAGPADAGAASRLVMFKTPSRNIGCAMTGGFARCDVGRHSWRAPAKPRRCMLDWGNAVTVERSGRAFFVCAGDTTYDPHSPTLGYGRSRTVGRFTCTSRRSGVTCRNGRNNHGFTVSRTKYDVF